MFFIFGFRDEDEQDDFEKRMALKLAEQEEEDLNRIKEESRKRREAILEKYRNQHLQQQNESRSEDADKGTFSVLVMFYIYS
jgi:serine/threonine-protein kinase PRP4